MSWLHNRFLLKSCKLRSISFFFFSMNRSLTMLVQRFFSKKTSSIWVSELTMNYVVFSTCRVIYLSLWDIRYNFNKFTTGILTIDAYYVLSHVPFLANFHLMRRHNFNRFLFLQGLIAALTENAWFSSSQVAVHYFMCLRISMKN